jgi:hypothetical protein
MFSAEDWARDSRVGREIASSNDKLINSDCMRIFSDCNWEFLSVLIGYASDGVHAGGFVFAMFGLFG